MAELMNITRGFYNISCGFNRQSPGMDQGNICRNLFHRKRYSRFHRERYCRSVSTSEAFNINLNILNIVRKACWSNAKTSLQHYEKEIISYKEIKLWNMEY